MHRKYTPNKLTHTRHSQDHILLSPIKNLMQTAYHPAILFGAIQPTEINV